MEVLQQVCGRAGWYGGRWVFRCSRHVGGASEVGSWEARECPWSVVVDVRSSPAYRRRCLTLSAGGEWAWAWAWREKGCALDGHKEARRVGNRRNTAHVPLLHVAAMQEKAE